MAIKIAGTDVISDDKRFINNESLPSIRPSLLLDFANSKTLDPRIDFTRSSTATYYDGKTHAKAEENLVTNSDSAITSYHSSITRTFNDATAPDGTTTATKLASDGTSATHHARVDTTSLGSGIDKTFSIYLKAGTLSYVQVFFQGSSTSFNVDLSTGSTQIASGSGLTAYGATNVGNGWYRVYGSATSSGADIWVLPVTSLSASYYESNTLSGDFYVWGAQLELRDSLTAYTPTTSQPITNYIPVLQTAASGTARFDHDPVTGESKGLLIEEQRTNLVSTSGDVTVGFSNIYADEVEAVAVAPDGSLDAQCFRGPKNDPSSRLQAGFSVSSGAIICVSWYEKTITGNFPVTTADAINPQTWVGVTTANPDTVAVEHVGNGWYRKHAIATTNASSQTIRMYFSASLGADDVVAIWGIQVEAGSFPTSYIPTSGSQVTRSADLAKMTGDNFSSWYRQDEGTVYCEFNASTQESSGYDRIIGLDDTSSNDNKISISTNNSTNQVYLSVYVDGTNQIAYDQRLFAIGDNKLSYCYKDNDYAFTGITSIGTVSTDTSARVPYSVNSLGIGASPYSSGSQFNACFKKFAYYPTRLTNAELVALTEA